MMAGRRRKDGPREANGNPQRRPSHERREDMTSVVLEARQRVFQVSPSVAKVMSDSSFLARLLAQGEVTQRQYNAADKYREAKSEYDRLHPVRRVALAGDLDRGGGHDSSDGTEPDYIRHFRYWRDRFLKFERALRETYSQDVHTKTVTDNVVLNGYEMPMHIPTLRIGLNALAKAAGL